MTRTALEFDDINKFFEIKDGSVVHKINRPRRKAGEVAEVTGGEGYKLVRHNKTYIRAHRIVFLLTYGYCPEVIDHINGIKNDNRPENLRAANYSENRWNSVVQSNNTSGYKGIHQLKNGGGYQAKITYNGKIKFLGTFKSMDLAKEFLDLAREMVHGSFAHNGVKA